MFLTGHTGFKGAWLTVLLKELGHEVCGLSLPPERDSLFETAGIQKVLGSNTYADIREPGVIADAVAKCNPDVAIHFAAQALVLRSYETPVETFQTNVNGTLNFLAETQELHDSVRRLVITSDKVYRNSGEISPFVEGDSLGGRDVYSASKAMADILTSSWIHAMVGPTTAIARAGNVVGGGDAGTNRLVPDVIRSIAQGKEIILRNPSAIRPWQHVLDCLNGYLSIVDLLGQESHEIEWNVGPDADNEISVEEMVSKIAKISDSEVEIRYADRAQLLHEEMRLTLDSARLKESSTWSNSMDIDKALEKVVEWHRRVDNGEDPFEITARQCRDFLSVTPQLSFWR